MPDGYVKGAIYEDRFGTLFLCERETGELVELVENGPLKADEPTRLIGMTRSLAELFPKEESPADECEGAPDSEEGTPDEG
jgi:hypothetical protein